ncbi:MAG TPA: hypothetical protein VEQ59_12975 [Polyangiaceae bacterium]|nr:hypothetical protein [Polyangiaceae bacterium]
MVRRAKAGWGWLLSVAPALTLVVACGGIVERRADGSEPDPGGDSTPSDSTSDDPTSPSHVEGDTELGACTLGPAESRAVPCAWVADRRCYTEREMACNCACPRNRDSQCVSGFDGGPNGHVKVSCD